MLALVQRVSRAGGRIRAEIATTAGLRTAAGEALLVAAGRRPNVEDLGLEQAGVAYTGRGITVDERLRTSQRHIYAAGDVAGGYQFTHLADHHARVVVRNILTPLLKSRRTRACCPGARSPRRRSDASA